MDKKALLIGRGEGLMWAMPQLLHRAGFLCDVVTSSKIMKKCRFVRQCHLVASHQSLIPLISSRMKEEYDWVIATEDGILSEILQSNLLPEEKLKLLPVLHEKNFIHLYSKIGLSRVFRERGVKTPPFVVAAGLTEVLEGAEQLGYPVLLKVDSSGGCGGISVCESPDDVKRLKESLFQAPLLVQKKMEGFELDLSALFFNGKLIHFTYAKIQRSYKHAVGISIVRSYTPSHYCPKEIFDELEQVGLALGAHGFVNIGCMQTEEGRYFFEADMRPNVWVETARFWGEDPANRIARWFSHRETLSRPLSSDFPKEIIVPYFLRLHQFELLINRYKVWKFIPMDDRWLVLNLIISSFVCFDLKHYFYVFVKIVVPKRFHNKLKKLRNKIRFLLELRYAIQTPASEN